MVRKSTAATPAEGASSISTVCVCVCVCGSSVYQAHRLIDDRFLRCEVGCGAAGDEG